MSLTLTSISKSFGEKVIFSDLSYTFGQRGIYALVGESGRGKTTLIRMIAGLDRDYIGQIDGGGTKNVSVLFQEHRLFPQLSALDNILLVSRQDLTAEEKERAVTLLLALGFKKEELELKPAELSGGLKQRISLVRALMRPAPVLLLDEPTKELDAELCTKVNDLIIAEAKRRLVIISTHSQKDIDYLGATKILI